MRTNRQYRLPLLAFGLACSLWSCGGPVSRSQFVLGTVCTIRVEDRGGAALLDRAFARLRQIEDELSVNKPGSQIDAVNAASGSAPVAVGSDALAIVRRDLQLASWSDGAFDPSVGPLVKLWGIGFERTGTASPPAPADIAAAKALVDWKDVRLDEAKSEIFLARKGMALAAAQGVDVILVDKDRKVYMSPGVSTYFEITDSSFSPAE